VGKLKSKYLEIVFCTKEEIRLYIENKCKTELLPPELHKDIKIED